MAGPLGKSDTEMGFAEISMSCEALRLLFEDRVARKCQRGIPACHGEAQAHRERPSGRVPSRRRVNWTNFRPRGGAARLRLYSLLGAEALAGVAGQAETRPWVEEGPPRLWVVEVAQAQERDGEQVERVVSDPASSRLDSVNRRIDVWPTSVWSTEFGAPEPHRPWGGAECGRRAVADRRVERRLRGVHDRARDRLVPAVRVVRRHDD